MSEERKESRGVERRRLLGWLGLAGTAPLWLAGAQAAADEKPKPSPVVKAAPPEAPPKISEDAKTLAEMARRRYGKHLSHAQLEELTGEIDDNLQAGARLREAKLVNADEPDFVFRAES